MAIYKLGRGFQLGTSKNKSSKWPERDLNRGAPDCESDALTTRPCCPQEREGYKNYFISGDTLTVLRSLSSMKSLPRELFYKLERRP